MQNNSAGGLMHNHHDSFINFPLGTICVTMPLWISHVQEWFDKVGNGYYDSVTHWIIPTLSIALILLQCCVAIRKLTRKGP